MCIAIMSPENCVVPKDHLEQSFLINDDGAGFMYAENDELHIQKGFMDFESFYEAYKPHENKPVAIHFRITTHGDSNQENTHPFQVGKNLGMIHNGIINAVDRPDRTKSDTYWFNQSILVPIYKRDSRFVFKEPFKELIRQYIGHSKLVFLNNKGHHTIVNEQMGTWDEGIWYSNTSYKPRNVVTHLPAKTDDKKLSIGSRVEVRYEYNKNNNGFGVVEYFTGGGMIGIKMDGQDKSRQIHISFIYPIAATFEKGDWVVKKDDPNKIGEVQGLVGNSAIVRYLDDMGVFSKPDYVISLDKLEYWFDTTKEVH